MKKILGIKLEKEKRVGLQIKLTVVFTVLLVGLSTFYFFLNYPQSLVYLNEGLGEQLIAIAKTSSLQIDSNIIKSYINGELPENALRKQQHILKKIKLINKVDAVYILVEKDNLAKSIIEEKSSHNFKKIREIDSALSSAFSGKEAYTKQLGPFKSAYFPIKDKEGKTFAVLGVDAHSKSIIKSIERTKQQTVIFLIFSTIISIFVSMVVAAAITTPIKQLVFATLKVSKGDLQSNVRIKNLWGLPYRDEIGELAISFNEMIKGLREKEEENRQLYNEIKTLNIELEERIKHAIKELVEREEERIQELKLAQQIQRALLPQSYSCDNITIETKFIPAKELGGDFYNFWEIEDNYLGIVIGDVTGKGVSAALLMAMIIGILHSEGKKALSPRDVLSKTNTTLKAHIETESSFFASSFYAVLDTKNLILSFSKAGHERPIWFKRDTCEVETLDAKGVFLGVFEGADFEEKSVKLQKGDKIVFYTDGVYEAKNSHGEIFGEERIFQILKDNPYLSATETINKIYNDLLSFVGNKNINDDITLLVLQV